MSGRAGYYLSRTVLALARQVPCPEAPQRRANRDSSLKAVITFTPLAEALQLSTQAFTVGRSTPGWALGVQPCMAQQLKGWVLWQVGHLGSLDLRLEWSKQVQPGLCWVRMPLSTPLLTSAHPLLLLTIPYSLTAGGPQEPGPP